MNRRWTADEKDSQKVSLNKKKMKPVMVQIIAGFDVMVGRCYSRTTLIVVVYYRGCVYAPHPVALV